MHKKLLAIFVIAVFLITSIGAISAADSISVKVTWDGNDAPGSVTVNLIKDGNVVDSAKLSASNSWKTTFKVDGDGSYQVQEVISDDYSYSVSGNADNGFVISNKLVKTDDVLSATEDEAVGEDSSEDTVLQETDDVITLNDTQDDGNASETADENVTDDDNATEDTNVTEDDNATEGTDDESEEVTETVTTTTTEHQITKTVKQADKKKPVNNTTKVKNRNTGFPVAILVCAVFAAAFVPFTRKK